MECKLTFVQALFCSKEGSAQVRLKLGVVGDDTGHNFTFTAPQSAAHIERDTFKKELTSIISRNRAVLDITPRPPLAAPVLPVPAPNVTTPRPIISHSRASTSRAESVSSTRATTPVIIGNGPASDFRLRKTVLMNNPDLRKLHRELVMSGQITEAEFWDGREVIIVSHLSDI